MLSLTIPDTGLALVGAPDESIGNSNNPDPAVQALRFVLPRDLVEELIQQSPTKFGRIAEICFGKQKSIIYSGKVRDVFSDVEANRTEVYRQSGDKHELHFQALISHVLTAQNARSIAPTTDDAILKLRNQLREHNQEKELHKTRIADRSELPPALSGRRALVAKNKKTQSALKSHRPKYLAPTLTRSMPSSPSFSATRSPSLHPSRPPTSTPTLESPKTLKLKALRIPILHLLAVRPISEKSLQRLTRSSQEDCAELVNKFSKPSRDDSGLILSDRWYKELDVWKFPYSDEERRLAIDNSISAFDRLRLSREDKQWDMLLRSQVRGKGKGRELSRLNLQNSTALPAIKVSNHSRPSPKVEGKATPAASLTELKDGRSSEKASSNQLSLKRGSTQRSQSQPPAKKQKIGDKEPESKGLISKPSKKNERVPVKPKPAGKQSSKIKSSEYIQDSSDDSEDERSVSKAELPVVDSKPEARLTNQATQANNASTSLKRKQEAEPVRLTKKPTVTSANEQHSDTRTSRKKQATSATLPPKPVSRPRVNSSPSKPSPLGSSPPTNASDFESDHHYNASSSSSSPLINEIKRGMPGQATVSGASAKPGANDQISVKKAATLANGISKQSDHWPAKRHRPMPSDGSTSTSSPTEDTTLRLAQRFKSYYLRYERLYHELSKVPDPPYDKLQELSKWNEKLITMKQDILKAANGM